MRAFAGPPYVFVAKTPQNNSKTIKKPGRIRPSTGESEENMFAVIKTGGKQYRVAADEVIKVSGTTGEPGDIVEFGEVLILGGDNAQVGAPTVAGATVAGEVVSHGRGPKIIAFKKRRRKNSRRKRGYRDEFTLVRITEILTDGKKPEKKVKAETPEAGAEIKKKPAKKPAKKAAKE